MGSDEGHGNSIKRILVVGGGTAGWLAACHLARVHRSAKPDGVRVTLVESRDIPTVGVGEGTVPAIRGSLRHLGIRETDLIREADATFKQSIKFVDWMRPDDSASANCYHHVFNYPEIAPIDLTPYWLMESQRRRSYVDTVSMQGRVCDAGFGPKTMTHAEYDGAFDYAYHLDAVKFAGLLMRHGTQHLGIEHLQANVEQVTVDDRGDIQSVTTDEYGNLAADVFVDCSGFSSLLLGKALGIEFIDRSDVLFVDNALAIQVPYDDDQAAIACHTIATAKDAGWIWDIGLHHRRGTGYVYAEKYCSRERAEAVFRDYLRTSIGDRADELPCRRIPMKVGYRERFWVGNCVAIGLSQGFVEPLEATGILVFDATARMLAELMPPTRRSMAMAADRFNERVRIAWDRVIDFIKLHYFLSDRDDSDFWRDNREPRTAPDSLLRNLELWRERPPNEYDFASRQEIFGLANYLYVLYGMGFVTEIEPIEYRYAERRQAERQMERIHRGAKDAMAPLLPHRVLIERIKAYGLQTI